MRATRVKKLSVEKLRAALRRRAPAAPAIIRRDRVYVVVSDVHVPYHDPVCLKAVCDLIKDVKPHGFVINGDFLDLAEISKHSRGSLAQLEGKRIADTFDAANSVLDYYDDALQGARDKHFTAGNHEYRLQRWLETGDNAVFAGDAGVSIPHRLGLEKRGYVYRPDYPNAYVKLGHLVVTHGITCQKHAAAGHLDRYHHSVLVGHTHTSQSFHASTFNSQQGGYCAGHMANPKSEAMKYAPVPNRWVQGFAVVTVEPNDNFHCQLVNFVDGVAYFGARRYGKGENHDARLIQEKADRNQTPRSARKPKRRRPASIQRFRGYNKVV